MSKCQCKVKINMVNNAINDKWRNTHLGTWLDMGKYSRRSGALWRLGAGKFA
jgi:hypothetical protein